jgi:hypothetical protein
MIGHGRSSPSLLGVTQGRLAPVYVLMQGAICILRIWHTSLIFNQKCVSIPFAIFYQLISIQKEMSISGKIIQKLTHSVYVLLLSIYSISFSSPINDFTFLRICLSPHRHFYTHSTLLDFFIIDAMQKARLFVCGKPFLWLL